MKKNRVRVIVVVSLVLLAIAGLTVFQIHENRVAEMERIELEEKNALRIAYDRQRYAFHLKSDIDRGLYVYLPFESIFDPDGDSSYNYIYCDLAYYEQQTGIQLTINEVKEYLSQEYEDDGTVRIYTNGRHPKIEGFVLWALDRQNSAAMEKYNGFVWAKCLDYTLEHPEHEWDAGLLHEMPLQWVQEGIKKAADPDYEVWLDPDAKPMTREEMLA